MIACFCVTIGGFTNPLFFTIADFDPEFWSKTKCKVCTAISFGITTIGFVWIGVMLLKHAL